MSVEANIAQRKAAEAATAAARRAGEQVVDLINGELRTLINKFGVAAVAPFFAPIRECYCGHFPTVPSQALIQPPTKPPRPQGNDVDAALESIEEALELADEVPERGREFAESVSEKLRAIAETIEKTDEVTAGQLAAIENMRGGLERWTR